MNLIITYEEKKYKDEVPDTLDLAERAGLAINSLMGMAYPEHMCETYQPALKDLPQEAGHRSPMVKWYPIYRRDHFKAAKAPMREAQRYVAPVLIWQ